MEPRRRLFWKLHDFGSGRGLEIGPLMRPLVLRDEADVHYVDVHDQEGLRASYADQPNVDKSAIPFIDYALIQPDGRTLSLAEAAAPGAPFDWVVASHVIEHVPDVIGWLADIAELVADDGVLVLAVPDRRYTFDVHRPPTSVGAMLQAHRSGDQVPSVRAVYDHFSRAVDNHAQKLWRGDVPTYDSVIHGAEYALERVEESLKSQYVDCHVWIFTADLFLQQMRELRRIGLSSWVVEEIHPATTGVEEFRVRMRRLPRSVDPVDDVPSEIRSEHERPDWLETLMLGDRAPALERRIARLEGRLARRTATLHRLQTRADAQKRRLARQQQDLDDVRSSRQWRVGGALLAPARALRAGLRRAR